MLRSSCEQICSEPFFVLLGCRKACHLLADPIFERTDHYSSKTWCWNVVSFQIQNSFYIRCRIVLGWRDRWDLVSYWVFDVNACIFAVFERQFNKCSPVATTSSPSTCALLRDPLGDPLGAVTDLRNIHTLSQSKRYFVQWYIFLESPRFFTKLEKMTS